MELDDTVSPIVRLREIATGVENRRGQLATLTASREHKHEREHAPLCTEMFPSLTFQHKNKN
jgi:uncharacterized protein Veg